MNCLLPLEFLQAVSLEFSSSCISETVLLYPSIDDILYSMMKSVDEIENQDGRKPDDEEEDRIISTTRRGFFKEGKQVEGRKEESSQRESTRRKTLLSIS